MITENHKNKMRCHMWSNFLISRSEAHKLLTTTDLERGRANTNTQPFKPTEKRKLSHKGKGEE